MAKTYIFYNPEANEGRCKEQAEALREQLGPEAVLCDLTRQETYEVSLFAMKPEDRMVLCGGDGTLNRFVNVTEGLRFSNEIDYYPAGSRNDLARDLEQLGAGRPFPVKEYLEDLPTVRVRNTTYRFLNGVGLGMDGYCAMEAGRLRARGQKTNLEKIARRGILRAYRPVSGTVTVDGVPHTYEKIWVVPTMNGRYCSGGILAAPGQDRKNPAGTVSVLVLHDGGRLPTCLALPDLLRGRFSKYHSMVEQFSGHEITVTFAEPKPLQIDGEIVADVTSYTVSGRQKLEKTTF